MLTHGNVRCSSAVVQRRRREGGSHFWGPCQSVIVVSLHTDGIEAGGGGKVREVGGVDTIVGGHVGIAGTVVVEVKDDFASSAGLEDGGLDAGVEHRGVAASGQAGIHCHRT